MPQAYAAATGTIQIRPLRQHHLAAVGAMLAGPDALGAMEAYLERIIDQPRRDQSFEIVAAAIAQFGGAPPVAPATWAVEAFQELLATAQDLEQRFRSARA
jgi:hypothetical protein